MNDREFIINEKIARLKGWRQDLLSPDGWVDPEGQWDKPGLPAWTEDKNLMLAEKLTLYKGQLHLFDKALEFLLERDSMGVAHSIPLHMASADLEAEAYLMVLEGLAKP